MHVQCYPECSIFVIFDIFEPVRNLPAECLAANDSLDLTHKGDNLNWMQFHLLLILNLHAVVFSNFLTFSASIA